MCHGGEGFGFGSGFMVSLYSLWLHFLLVSFVIVVSLPVVGLICVLFCVVSCLLYLLFCLILHDLRSFLCVFRFISMY